MDFSLAELPICVSNTFISPDFARTFDGAYSAGHTPCAERQASFLDALDDDAAEARFRDAAQASALNTAAAPLRALLRFSPFSRRLASLMPHLAFAKLPLYRLYSASATAC